MKTLSKIAIVLLPLLACSTFSCKKELAPLSQRLKSASLSSSGYGSVTTVVSNLQGLGPLAVDAANNLYFKQSYDDTLGIFKITPAGKKNILVGGRSGFPHDGTGTDVRFSSILGLTMGSDSALYTTEGHFGWIRKITLSGVVTIISNTYTFEDPQGLKTDTKGNFYVVESPVRNDVRVQTKEGKVYVLAGSGPIGFMDGPGPTAAFNFPLDLAICHDSTVFVADAGNGAIRKITYDGTVSTFKTGISGTSLIFDASGNLYIGEGTKIGKITPDGVVSTLAGSDSPGSSDGVGSTAAFSGPLYLAINGGILYVADVGNGAIRKVVIK